MNMPRDYTYYIPPSVAKVVQRHIKQCQNLSLVLDKYVAREVIDDSKHKGIWLHELLQRKTIDDKLAQNVYLRWRTMLQSQHITPFEAQLDWRMIVGLGGDSVLETDITLHHLYGIPIIPGSALKGLTRTFVASEKEQYFIPSETSTTGPVPSLKEETDHADIKQIFGTQQTAGTVIFFDALPKNGNAALVVDIMNPHYPNYYNTLKSTNTTPPTNDQSPNPITFLAVKETTFSFALAPRDSNNPQHKIDANNAKEWLLEALQKYGVGGKTSAGYGYFQAPDNIKMSLPGDIDILPKTPIVDPEQKKAEGYIQELNVLKNVAGQIYGYYQRWQEMQSKEARQLLGEAIIEKVRKAGREKQTAEKAWFKELVAFLNEV